ncbi:MAG: sensor domain-containing diguanylate cyclase [Candidatus Omnitrophica bacterium]|nr:sensor domain-containing diguanylate cyclase [Candidatus Omnitrophota bacterium]
MTLLRYGVFDYNIYVPLFCIAAFAGYKILSRLNAFRNRSLAMLEVLEVEENSLALKISKKEKDMEFAEKRFKGYAALKDITEALSSTLNLDETIKLVTSKAFKIIGSDRVFLFLSGQKQQRLTTFDSWILKHRKSLIIQDLDNDFRFSIEALADPADRQYKSIIGVPLMSEKKVMGVLRMDSMAKGAYTQDDLRLLDIISDLAAVSIENSMLYERTNELAITDGLTGFYVQRYFKEALELKVGNAGAQAGRFSVAMIDVDYFKGYNDKYGHAAGDLLLIKLAQAIRALAGEGHVIARYGGEEFAMILPKADKKAAMKISEDIRKGLEKTLFTLRRDEVKLTVSIGISSFPEDGTTAEKLLKTADSNLYKAKESGRNRTWPGSI